MTHGGVIQSQGVLASGSYKVVRTLRFARRIVSLCVFVRDTRFIDRVEYNVQVQLRFCVIDSTCRQLDCFPANINVKINNMMATLPVTRFIHAGHCNCTRKC